MSVEQEPTPLQYQGMGRKLSLLVDGLYRWQGSPAVEPYGRHIEISRSPDLIHWSRSQTMGFAREGQFQRPASLERPLPNEQTHEGASVWNRGNVLIGITGFWRGAKDWTGVVHPLGFLVSNDGLHFREPIPNFIFAEIVEDGRDWDDGGLSQGQGFENVGEMTYIWYGQMDQRMGPRTGLPWKRHGGVGLLLLGRDRFGSLSLRDPDEKGILITSDLELRGPASLWVNAEGLGDLTQVSSWSCRIIWSDPSPTTRARAQPWSNNQVSGCW